MTTEERFTKIENALHSVSDNQARHDAAIRDLIVVSRTLVDSQKETNSQIQQLNSQMQQLHSHIQQLVVQWQEGRDDFDKKLRTMADRSAEVEEKLHDLIEVVDRIIRRKNGSS